MKSFLYTFVLFAAIGAVGCNKKKVPTSDFEKAFAPATPAAASKSAEPKEATFTARFSADPVVASASQDAMDAVRVNDLPRAAGALLVLRQQQNLTPEQWIATQDMMASVQSQLAERAARGDAAALRAFEEIRRNKKR